ncbi:hypothetical protein LWI29_003617 [Acer saccharum]|uniref:Uncharacterized protein n=1 Tax=Acer saccharum TaxID=4024 RepID=A0AA39VFA2_ACESA|nr:hypothetical protein LWI29_003617 [Acer saccharum]
MFRQRYGDAGSRATWKSDTSAGARKDVSSIWDIQKGDSSKEKGASISRMVVVVEKIPTILGTGRSKESVCANRESKPEMEGGSANLRFSKVQDCVARNLGVCFGKEVLSPKEKGGVGPVSKSLVLSKISLGSKKERGPNNKGKVQELNKGIGNIGLGPSIGLSVGLSAMEIDKGATTYVQTELERKKTGCTSWKRIQEGSPVKPKVWKWKRWARDGSRFMDGVDKEVRQGNGMAQKKYQELTRGEDWLRTM